jgi:hypothetical protein
MIQQGGPQAKRWMVGWSVCFRSCPSYTGDFGRTHFGVILSIRSGEMFAAFFLFKWAMGSILNSYSPVASVERPD